MVQVFAQGEHCTQHLSTRCKLIQPLSLQLEEEGKKATPKSEMQRVREKEAFEIIARAQRAKLEEREEIKRMNQMIMHAKCMAVRDAQVLSNGLHGFGVRL